MDDNAKISCHKKFIHKKEKKNKKIKKVLKTFSLKDRFFMEAMEKPSFK